ncbi:hypothetical protein BH10PSE18_BH10PSE18_18770 [soil metagenome]
MTIQLKTTPAELSLWSFQADQETAGHVRIPLPTMRVLVQDAQTAHQLHALINTPQTEDFLSAVRLEAAHQVDRWGDAHARGKSAENWFWLVGYLAGKALRAAVLGDKPKALHHTISSAAACCNWWKAITADTTGRGIGADEDIKPIGLARFDGHDSIETSEREAL